GRKRVQIGGIDLAVDPALEADSAGLRGIERAMADAMHRATRSRQLVDEMAADEPVRAGDPDRHASVMPLGWILPRAQDFRRPPYPPQRPWSRPNRRRRWHGRRC